MILDDLFITNIIELSKNIKLTKFKIENFFDTYNNSRIIYFFDLIKNIQNLYKIKSFEK